MDLWIVSLLVSLWTVTIQGEDTIGMYSTPEAPVQVGTQVILTCWAPANPLPSYINIYSTKPGILHNRNSNMLTPYNHNGQERVKVEYTIPRVSKGHTDKYTCRISWESGDDQRTTYNLTIYKAVFFTTQPQSPVEPGGRVIFYCYTDVNPEYMYLYKGQQQLLHKSRENLDNFTRTRYDEPRTFYNFAIQHVSANDAGNYTCTASYGEGQRPRMATYRLDVNRPPSDAYVTDTSMIVPRGRLLSLTCHVTDRGLPEAEIYWYKHGHPDVLVRQSKIESYQVAHVASGNRGIYYCVAKNKWGSSNISQNVSVIVIWPPSGAIVIHPNYTAIGQSFSLTCNLIEWGFPVGKILWYKAPNVDEILSGASQGRLVIQNVSDVSQAGPYFCVGSNDNGDTAPSPEVIIPVKTPLTIEARSPEQTTLHPLFNKDSFILNITVSGTDIGEPLLVHQGPTETYTLPLGEYITKSTVQGHFAYGQTEAEMYTIRFDVGKGLTCDTVNYMDGRYQFVAKKMDGWATRQNRRRAVFILQLQYPAIWKADPGSLPAVIGDHNVTISNDVCGSPLPNLRWSLNHKPLPDDVIVHQSAASITIPEVKADHTGIYTCIASNVIAGKKYERKFEVLFQTNETLLSLPRGGGDDKGGVLIYIYIAVAVFVVFLIFGLIGLAVFRYRKTRDTNPYENASNDMVQIFPPNNGAYNSVSTDDRLRRENGYVNVDIKTTQHHSVPQITIDAPIGRPTSGDQMMVDDILSQVHDYANVSINTQRPLSAAPQRVAPQIDAPIERPTSVDQMMVDNILSEVHNYANVSINSRPLSEAPYQEVRASRAPPVELIDRWSKRHGDMEESDDDYIDIDDEIFPDPSSTRNSVAHPRPPADLRPEPNDLTDLYAKPMKKKDPVKNPRVRSSSGPPAGSRPVTNDLTDLYAKPMKRNATVKTRPANPAPETNDLTDLYAKPMKKKPPAKGTATDASSAGKPVENKIDDKELLYAKPTIKRQPTFNIVNDGVLYSEMSFKVPENRDPTAKPFIHGADDRVDYASIDWDKMDHARRSAEHTGTPC